MECNKLNIPEHWHRNPDGSYDVDGNAYLTKEYVQNGRLLVRIRKVSGNFSCKGIGLTTLEGSPREVAGYFNCSFNSLRTLQGKEVPQAVGGDFNCSVNLLTSLEGAPLIVNGTFNCSSNKLRTLAGSPGHIGREFNCSHNKLQTLEDGPSTVGGNYRCVNNLLKSLEGIPRYISENLFCQSNHIETLMDSPISIKENLDISNNPLKDLTNIPFIGKDLIANTRYHITKSTKIISAKVLPLYTNNPRREVHCIDWSGFQRPIKEYIRWIPQDLNITHINLTSQQKKALLEMQILQL